MAFLADVRAVRGIRWLWIGMAVTLAVLGGAGFGINSMRDRASRTDTAIDALAHLQTSLQLLNGLEWQAVVQQGPTRSMDAQINEADGSLDQDILDMRAALGPEEAGMLGARVHEYVAAIQDEVDLLRQGHEAAALTMDTETVDPGFKRLQDIMNAQHEALHRAQHDADFRERTTIWTLLGTAALMLAVLLWVIGRAHIRASVMRQEGLMLQELAVTREHDALHDDLTALPNRRRFNAVTADTLEESAQTGVPVAVLLLDIDGFKGVNDALGHDAGDDLLGQVAERLVALSPEAECVARLGGDEFAVLLPGATAERAQEVGVGLREALSGEFVYETLPIHLEVSVGVAAHPRHGADRATLMRHADVAMYTAKAARTGVEIYDPSRDRYSKDDLERTAELRQALESGELVVHYQPQYLITTGAVRGVEALVRWQHPRLGLLPPGQFLPLAEGTGLMHGITAYVLTRSINDCARWNQHGANLSVAVNLAPESLFHRDLAPTVERLLHDAGLDPSRLELEITEAVVLTDPTRVLPALHALRKLGVTLSLDDFGTGHSSIGRLRQLPLDVLKIDRSFVAAMDSRPEDAAIVHAAIQLAHAVGLDIVAEGVETTAVWDILHELKCDLAQGFLMSPAVPADEIPRITNHAIWGGPPVEGA
ncbi:MAG: bifunctional diguanylate cyclase/phosphodiesterase [Thermoleophilia bacterium]